MTLWRVWAESRRQRARFFRFSLHFYLFLFPFLEWIPDELADVTEKYEALLQMYGELVEKSDELKLDLEEARNAYRAQIQDLTARLRKANVWIRNVKRDCVFSFHLVSAWPSVRTRSTDSAYAEKRLHVFASLRRLDESDDVGQADGIVREIVESLFSFFFFYNRNTEAVC